jgi:hypothetical protein
MDKGGHYILLQISKTMTYKPANEAGLLRTHPWQHNKDKQYIRSNKITYK